MEIPGKKICLHRFYISGQGIILRPNFQRPGYFHGDVTYESKTILNGSFDIVAISNGERVILDKILANNPSWTYHQAKLLVLGNEIRRGQKIYIYVSPKQLYIRDYLLKFIPMRVATFRVSSLTKVNSWILSMNGELSGELFVQFVISIKLFLTFYRSNFYLLIMI